MQERCAKIAGVLQKVDEEAALLVRQSFGNEKGKETDDGGESGEDDWKEISIFAGD